MATAAPVVSGRPDDFVVGLAVDRDGHLVAGLAIYEEGNTPTFHAPGIYRSADGGRSWQPIGAGLANARITTLLGGAGLLMTSDGAGNALRWDAAQSRWTPVAGTSSSWPLESLAVVARRPNIGYLGTFDGGVFRTRDAGRSLEGIGFAGSDVRSVSTTSGGEVVYAVRRVLPSASGRLWARVGDLGAAPARCATG